MSRAFSRAERGFSLLELMIAVVILGVITSQMFVALSTQQRASTSTGRDMDLQEAARLVADLIAFDARNAGMMVPPEAAVSSSDGGANGPDRFCVSSSNYFRVEEDRALWDLRKERFPGAEVNVAAGSAIVQTVASSITGTLVSAASQLDIDGMSSPNDWNPIPGPGLPAPPFTPTGIIIARRDGRGSHCALVQGLSGNTFTLAAQHAVPAALINGLSSLAPRLAAVPAIVYELVPDPTDPDALGTLMRNGVAVSGQIEDLQIEYWVDTLGTTGASVVPNGRIDGLAEFPVHSLLGLNPSVEPPPIPATLTRGRDEHTPLSRIRNVRISVVARGTLPDVDSQGINRGRRPALANRAAAPDADSFSRRMYSVSVLPRNLLRADGYTEVD